jgi:hypothetical protein
MKISWIENPNDRNMPYCLFYTYKFLFLKNTKNSIFSGISKFRFWANFGNFRQFWADFASFTVVESMPKARLKSLKLHNSLTVNPKVVYSISLEIYNPPLYTYTVSRTPQSNCNHGSPPKSTKSHFGCLGCLGVKTITTMMMEYTKKDNLIFKC